MSAGGSKGSRNGKEDGFLVGSEVGDGDGLDFAGGIQIGEGGVRELISDRDDGGDFRGGGEIDGFGVAVKVVEFEGAMRG